MEKARGPLCSSVGRAVSRPQSRRRWKTEWITLSREAWGGLTAVRDRVLFAVGAPPPAFPRNPRGRLGFPGPTQGEG